MVSESVLGNFESSEDGEREDDFSAISENDFYAHHQMNRGGKEDEYTF